MAAQFPSIPDDDHLPDVADRARQLLQFADEWLFGTAMDELLAEFDQQLPAERPYRDKPLGLLADRADWLHHGEKLPDWLDALTSSDRPSESAELVAFLARIFALEKLAATQFHSRGDGDVYIERWNGAGDDLSEPLRSRVIGLADRLGLVTAKQPTHRTYDHTLVLGGGKRSPLLRARLCAELVDRGVVAGRIALLGSPRPVGPEERPATDQYAPAAADEFELLIAAATNEFHLTPKPVRFLCGSGDAEQICPAWSARFPDHEADTPPAFTHEREVDLIDARGRVAATALSASTGRPPVRPDTSDTFRLWARWARPEPAQRALLVTTQLFIPFQTFDGLRRLYLPLGVKVDSVGFDATWADRPLTAVDLLQEVLSGIRSARRLVVEACYALLKDVLGNPV